MAFRLNTVEYAWETNTTEQSGSTTYTTPDKLITIPETGSRTFLSVTAEMFVRDAQPALVINSFANTFITGSVDSNINVGTNGSFGTSTTVHHALTFKTDLTDLFNARFTGSAHTVNVRWSVASATSNLYTGHSAKLYITYQYDDAGLGTTIKTVRLPLDAFYGQLSTSQQVFGSTAGGYTNIPALDTFLPESTKDYKDIWIQYTGNDTGGASGQRGNMFTQIDSGSESTRYTLTGGSDTPYYDIQTISGTFDTSTAHTLKARANSGSRFTMISPTVNATYTYRNDLTTSVINSLMIPFNYDFHFRNNMMSPNLYGEFDFLIPEQNPYQAHSALMLIVAPISSIRTVGVGGKTITSTTFSRGTTAKGSVPCNIRFDANAKTSADKPFNSGYNSFIFYFNTGSIVGAGVNNFSGFNVSGFALLNYTASVIDSNPQLSQRTIFFGNSLNMGGLAISTAYVRHTLHPTQSINSALTSSYFCNGYLDSLKMSISNINNATIQMMSTTFDYTGSVGISSSFAHDCWWGSPGTTAGAGVVTHAMPFKGYLNYPSQPIANYYGSNYFNAKTNNILIPNSTVTKISTLSRDVILTYHNNAYKITGSLLNCSNTGSNYLVDIYVSGSNAPITPLYNLTSSGSGATKWFTFDWYENINSLYAVTKYPQNGISNSMTASNSNGLLSINYSAGGATEKSFTFIG